MSATDGANAVEAEKHAALLEDALFQVKRVIVGQDRMVERALVCLLARGHCLIEGVPGLAKTLTVSTLADVVGGSFARIQFTPDLVPADIVGTRIWRPSKEEFDIEWGPVFANLVLADEINRAPAKVQSALLEVMAERHVSIAGHTEPVPNPFLVLATQNPIESEGVYALPEAQRDRFLMQIVVDQPSYAEETEIARRMGVSAPKASQVLSIDQLIALQTVADEVFVHHAVLDYAVRIVMTTRDPEVGNVPQIASHLSLGASPRATLGMIAAGRALAVLRGRRFLTPQDLFDVAPEILRHRLILSYDALAEGVTTDDVIRQILATVPAPSVTPRQDDANPTQTPAPRWKLAPGNGVTDKDTTAAKGVASVSAKAAQLRRLELDVTIRLDGMLRGDFAGLQSGPGSETAGTRTYDVGDDARRIDWNLTARSLMPQVRTTEPDRELHTWLVVDRSPSMDFGTALCEKRDLAFSAAAAYGFLTARHGNRFGILVAGGDRVTRIGPSTTRSALFASLSKLYDATRIDGEQGAKVNVSAALLELERTRPRRGQIVVISDFLDDQDWAPAMRRLSFHHQVVAVQTIDPRELSLPAIGIAAFVDPETGRRLHVQTNAASLRSRYDAAAEERQESITQAIRATGAEHLVLGTDRDWLLDIVKFVSGRRAMRGRVRANRVHHAQRPNLTAVAAVPERSTT